jgi:hypothetical protein
MIADVFKDFFSFFWVIPEAGVFGFFFLLVYMVQFLIQVKVTSSRLQAFYPTF